MNMKIEWLRNKLKSLDMQGMIVSNPINIKYLTNIDAEGVLLITRKENIYITDVRYIESVQNVLTIDDDIIVENISDISKEDFENFFLFCENIGFEENYVTYSKYQEYMYKYKINNMLETEQMIEKQRMVKEEEEITNIKRACELTDDCFKHLLKYIKKGKTEKEIALEIRKYFVLHGADDISFEPIVASGINSSMPHAIPTDKKIESGDVITLDFGCKYKGYCSDMTRTIFVDVVQDYIKPVYDLVLKNQLQILREMREAIQAKVLFRMVDNDFQLHGYSLAHGLGHGVGLEIHEAPSLGPKNEMILKENMIVTDEPGIYIPGKFGIRIEDTCQITKSGCISLTQSDKNYIVI